jgi:class 3 adenylate cyclase
MVPQPPEARLSDAERDRVVADLREACVAGRLTLDEFSDRVGSALEARTRADLDPILKDLPVASANLPEARRRQPRRRIVAFMSGSHLKGRWRAAEHTTVVAFMGGCKIDMRLAEIDAPEVVLTVWSVCGGVDVIVPEGIDVEVTGFSIMGGRSVRTTDVPPVPMSPLVRIRAFPIMGGVGVRSRPPRRRVDQRTSVPDGSRKMPNEVDARDPPRGGSAGEAANRAAAANDLEARNDRAITTGGVVARDGQRSARGGPGADGTVTILFSDISDFSGLTERLGDRAMRELLVEHRDCVRRCVEAHGGREVKVQGDGFMLAFEGVARALRCARDIQSELARRAIERPDSAISVHMGVHTGEAITDGDDYMGHTVILASRLADVAGPGEVLVSSVARQLVTRSGEFSFGPDREVRLKGLKDIERASAFEWGSNDEPLARDGASGVPGEAGR